MSAAVLARCFRPALLGTLAFAVAAGWLAAQPPGPRGPVTRPTASKPAATKPGPKPPREEEEEPVKPPTKPTGKPPREEVEEPRPVKPGTKTPLRDDDDPPPVGVKPPEPADATPAVDLVQEAGQAKRPAIRELFDRLKVPFDEITEKNGTRTRVVPLPRYLGDRSGFTENLSYTILTGENKRGLSFKMPAGDIRSVRHYEQIAIDAATAFLGKGLDRLSVTNPLHTPRAEQLIAAEKVLTAAVRYHAAAREKKQRTGAGWEEVRQQLQAKLLDVHLEMLRVLGDAKDERADGLALRLAADHADNPQAQEALLVWQAGRLVRALGKDAPDKDYIAARQMLDRMAQQFPRARTEALGTLRAMLDERAKALLGQARENAKADPSAATTAFKAAEAIAPELEGLQELRNQLDLAGPILNVGVDKLPELMSPATARTDAERQAVELIFESLLAPVSAGKGGRSYRPLLAAGLPRPLLPAGRDIRLIGDARWAHGADYAKAISVLDVFQTLQLLQQSGAGPGGESADLFDLNGMRVESAQRLRLPFKQGMLDPLGLLTFKVLPGQYLRGRGLRADDLGFAKKPFGSGPFQYRGPTADREAVVFHANPVYGKRDGKAGRPSIREVRFVKRPSDYPARVRALQAGQVHLLTDVETEEMYQLLGEAELQGVIRAATPPNRRIHLLAVRQTGKLKDANVRRAIALALDREGILTNAFRAGHPEVHKPLNGPFPPGTWACSPAVEGPLYDSARAKTLFGQAGVSKDHLLRLQLKCPDVPRIQQACGRIKEQLGAMGVDLEVIALGPYAFHEQVKVEQNFQLAYATFDYASDLFWLGGLLDRDATEAGGRNYMGYVNDDLDRLFRQVRSHRDFDKVRRSMHQLHEQFNSQFMPFVPLWQLDMHLILHKDVLPVPAAERLDPVTVFDQIDEWKLAASATARR